jgi:hypothetical protein
MLVSHHETGVDQRRQVGDETVRIGEIARRKLVLNDHTHSFVALRG